MSSQVIPFRLRQRKDDDLSEALQTIPAFLDKSEVIREALRMYFLGAPTPLRDSYLKISAKSDFIPLPPPVVEAHSNTKHSDSPTVSTNTMREDDVDARLNRNLGF